MHRRRSGWQRWRSSTHCSPIRWCPSSWVPRSADMELFRELGLLVEANWRRQNYRESTLAGIAHDALAAAAMHERVTWQELLKWCVTTPLLDTDNRTFGDVPLRV